MKPEQELMTILGENVKKRRKKMGLSQEGLSEKMELAEKELLEKMGLSREEQSERMGLSKNTISKIENGEKFAHAKTLAYLAIALKTEVYELLKPDNVYPDNAVDIIAKYSDEVRDAVGELEKTYMGNIGR